MRPSTSFLLLLSACAPIDDGRDHTVITGTLRIPPAAVDEVRGNDTVAEPQPLGSDSTALTWRSVIVSGAAAKWPEPPALDADLDGDPDVFAFSPVATGTFTFTFTFETGSETAAAPPAPEPDTGDTAAEDTAAEDTAAEDTAAEDTAADDTGAPATLDADVFELQLIDPVSFDEEAGTGVLGAWSTDGTGGVLAFTYDVAAGTDYVLRVLPKTTDAPDAALPYTLVVSGSAPDDRTILVGAYPTDALDAQNPLGGTNATGWSHDAATFSWNGTWTMRYFRSMEAAVDDNPDDLFEPSPTVVEGQGTAYVRAATLTSLNAGLAAGALYASEAVEVEITDTTYTLEAEVVLDAVAPKVVGRQVAEATPDTTIAEIDPADYSLVPDTLVAEDIGMLSGLGYVDVVTGTSVIDPATTGWNGANDSDAYRFTVPETLNVRLTARWDDVLADLDFGIWYAGPDGALIDTFWTWSDTFCLTGANPEVCETVVTLEPDTAYYLVALGYLGSDEEPYTVELEWMAP